MRMSSWDNGARDKPSSLKHDWLGIPSSPYWRMLSMINVWTYLQHWHSRIKDRRKMCRKWRLSK